MKIHETRHKTITLDLECSKLKIFVKLIVHLHLMSSFYKLTFKTQHHINKFYKCFKGNERRRDQSMD